MLNGIKIRNFALLEDFEIGLQSEKLRTISKKQEISGLPALGVLNVFIGQNASGKTTFFEALRFLSVAVLRDVHVACNQSKQGSFSELISKKEADDRDFHFDLLYSYSSEVWLLYHLTISSDRHNRPYITSEVITKYSLMNNAIREEVLLEITDGKGRIFHQEQYEEVDLTEKKISALNIYGHQNTHQECVWLYNQITRFYLADFQNVPKFIATDNRNGGHKHLNHNFSNIENVLFYLKTEKKNEYKSLQKRLNQNLRNHNRLNLEKLEQINNEAQIKLLLVFLILSDSRPLIAFENPDTGLYYDMTDTLAEEIRDYSIRNDRSQIFLSTHNVNMLENFSPNEVWVFERFEQEDGSPIIKTRNIADDKIVEAMYEEGIGLSSLWYSGYLDDERKQ